MNLSLVKWLSSVDFKDFFSLADKSSFSQLGFMPVTIDFNNGKFQWKGKQLNTTENFSNQSFSSA